MFWRTFRTQIEDWENLLNNFWQLILNSSKCPDTNEFLCKVKIILHRIISVVWLTIFLSENRSLTQPRWWGKVSCSERENVQVASVSAVAYWTLMIARLSLSEWRRSSRLSEWLKAIISYGDWITFVNEIQFYLREGCKWPVVYNYLEEIALNSWLW